METNHFIKLESKVKLDKEQVKAFYTCVKEIASNMIYLITDKPITLTMKDATYVYCINLNMNVGNMQFQHLKDFVKQHFPDCKIHMSGHEDKKPLDYTDNIYGARMKDQTAIVPKDNDFWPTACEQVSKYHHNCWMQSKLENGWRHGIHYDMDNKTHPLLVTWELLPEQYKQIDQNFANFFEKVLNSLNLKISPK